MKFLSARDIAQQGVPYRAVLDACADGTLSAQRIGPSFAIPEQDAEVWVAAWKEKNDPHNVEGLKARIAELEAQLEKRAA